METLQQERRTQLDDVVALHRQFQPKKRPTKRRRERKEGRKKRRVNQKIR